MNKQTKSTVFSIAAASATNVLGLKPVQVGETGKLAPALDNAMEIAMTSGRKYPRLAVTPEGKLVVASRPTIKRNGWKYFEGNGKLGVFPPQNRSEPAAE